MTDDEIRNHLRAFGVRAFGQTPTDEALAWGVQLFQGREPVVRQDGATHEQTITVAGPGGEPMVEERRRCSCSIGHDHTDHDEGD